MAAIVSMQKATRFYLSKRVHMNMKMRIAKRFLQEEYAQQEVDELVELSKYADTLRLVEKEIKYQLVWFYS